MDGAGHYVDTTPDASTNYSLPGLLTPGGNSNLATSISVRPVRGRDQRVGTERGCRNDDLRRLRASAADANSGWRADQLHLRLLSGHQRGRQSADRDLDGARALQAHHPGRLRPRHPRGDRARQRPPSSQVDTQYGPCGCSPIGKMSAVSQPYAPGATPVWTTYTYDGSGRTLTVTAPDGSVTRYAYAGNQTTVTDPAGKWKTS